MMHQDPDRYIHPDGRLDDERRGTCCGRVH